MKKVQSQYATWLLGTLFLLAAPQIWATADEDAVQEMTAAAEPAVEAAETDAAAAAEAEGPTGLNFPMDGSSLEAWEASMARVEELGSARERLQLQDAFDYLLMFDLGSRNDPATLAARLDGLTGNEIIERVKYGQRKGK